MAVGGWQVLPPAACAVGWRGTTFVLVVSALVVNDQMAWSVSMATAAVWLLELVELRGAAAWLLGGAGGVVP